MPKTLPELDDGAERKRLKLGTASPQFDDSAKEVDWTIIPDTLSAFEPGWIEGTVSMVFGAKTKADCVLQNSADFRKLTVSICCHDWILFRFIIGQTVRLSLKGARISTKRPSSAPGAMPFSLVFSEGATARFVVGRGILRDGEVIDSWIAPKEEPDWFSTPHPSQFHECLNEPSKVNEKDEDLSPSQMQIGTMDSRQPSPSLAETMSSPSSPSPATPGPGENVSVEPFVDLKNVEYADQNKPQRRNDRHQNKKEPEKNIEKAVSLTASARPKKSRRLKKRDTRHEGPKREATEGGQTTAYQMAVSKPECRPSQEQTGMIKPMEDIKPQPSPSPPPTRNPALNLEAGLQSEKGAYPSLDSIRSNMLTHVIGIVAGIEEPQGTKTGNFKVSITLIDPSKFLNGRGFKITCFMRADSRGLLPAPARGHVLLLRNVKTSDWLGNVNGSIYPDKLKWIAYDPATGKTYFPQENALHPYFDTFHKACASEVRYFVQLGEWWRAVKEEEEQGAISIESFERKKREHRLIKDCRCNEFFDATIEVVKRFEDYEQTVFLFSDYTPHPLRSSSGEYGQWAVSVSTSKVPEERLNIMTVGTFQHLKNVRLKINGYNDLEMDLFATECTELDPKDDSSDIHLQALLKRREAYLLEHPQSEDRRHRSGNEITAISEISEPGHYNILAELIYRYSGRETACDLYVTDYTENTLLSEFKPPSLKRAIEDRPDIPLLQIAAWDGEEFLRQQKQGSIFIFQDVRITSDSSGGLKGQLKLAEQRITKVNIRENTNTHLLELLERRKEFEGKHVAPEDPDESKAIDQQALRQADSAHRICLAIDPHHFNQHPSTVSEIKRNLKCPNKFRLQARIIDFFPLDISDFSVRWCRNCKQPIPENRNACTMCEDDMAEFVTWVFRFFFMVEDEAGDKLIIDCCNEGASFLSDLEACDLRSNRDRLMAVKRRFRTLLGNLVEVHQGFKRQETVQAEYGSYLDIVVKSWEVIKDDRTTVVYSLTGCRAPEP